MPYIKKCLVAGGVAGLLNGIFGAGGGLVLIPLFINWIKLEEKRAFATSIAVIFPLSIVSFALFCTQGDSVWKETLPYLLGGMLGGGVSSKLFQNLSLEWLHRIFGALILFGGIKAVFLL